PMFLFLFSLLPRPPTPTLFPYTTLFRSHALLAEMPAVFAAPHRPEVRSPNTVYQVVVGPGTPFDPAEPFQLPPTDLPLGPRPLLDRKSTRLNSSHLVISYAVFCLKKKKL